MVDYPQIWFYVHLKINENFLQWTIPKLTSLSHVAHMHMRVSHVCIHKALDPDSEHATH